MDLVALAEKGVEEYSAPIERIPTVLYPLKHGNTCFLIGVAENSPNDTFSDFVDSLIGQGLLKNSHMSTYTYCDKNAEVQIFPSYFTLGAFSQIYNGKIDLIKNPGDLADKIEFPDVIVADFYDTKSSIKEDDLHDAGTKSWLKYVFRAFEKHTIKLAKILASDPDKINEIRNSNLQ